MADYFATGGINDGSNYDFYAGETAAGTAIWSKNFNQTVPYFSWWNNSGITAMTYFPKMKKLIAVTETTCLGCGVRVDFDFDTYVLLPIFVSQNPSMHHRFASIL